MKEIIIRIALHIVGIAAGFASGYFYNTDTQVRTQIQTQIQEKIVTKRVVVRETAPDGTTKEKVEETVTENKKGKTNEKDRKPDQTISKAKAEKLLKQANYSVGLRWDRSIDAWKNPKEAALPTGFEFGYRVLADGWVTGGYGWEGKEILLGVRWEF